EFQMKDIQEKAKWYGNLIHVEMVIIYELYYGKRNIKKFYNQEDFQILDDHLLKYLQEKNNPYYKRLRKFKVIKSGPYDLW
ncbi:MAG TPA: hypothetical protein VFK40_01045, partial [Nitrososphaeraceae archaeon]|nr:hypothetical protein [Nitrososphaeraceae archaeon]